MYSPHTERPGSCRTVIILIVLVLFFIPSGVSAYVCKYGTETSTCPDFVDTDGDGRCDNDAGNHPDQQPNPGPSQTPTPTPTPVPVQEPELEVVGNEVYDPLTDTWYSLTTNSYYPGSRAPSDFGTLDKRYAEILQVLTKPGSTTEKSDEQPETSPETSESGTDEEVSGEEQESVSTDIARTDDTGRSESEMGTDTSSSDREYVTGVQEKSQSASSGQNLKPATGDARVSIQAYLTGLNENYAQSTGFPSDWKISDGGIVSDLYPSDDPVPVEFMNGEISEKYPELDPKQIQLIFSTPVPTDLHITAAEGIFTAVMDEPGMKETLAAWKGDALTAEEKEEMGNRLFKVVAKGMGISDDNLKVLHLDSRGELPKGYVSSSVPENGVMTITADPGLWSDPAKVIAAISHEVRHIQQVREPLSLPAGTFRNAINACYGYRESGTDYVDFRVDPTGSRNWYYLQTSERDGFGIHDAVLQRFYQN